MVNPIDVVIVGAGLSGIMAGKTLAANGKSVVLLDKGRSVGGRCATRRLSGGAADTGAQFFTCREPEFQAYVDAWLEQGIIFEWSRGWSDGSIVDTRDGHSRYAVRKGMNALPKFLAEGLDIRDSTEVTRINHSSQGWTIEDSNANKFYAHALLMTPPVPQSLKLLEDSVIAIPDDVQAALETLTFNPCVVGLIHVSGDISLPEPGVMQRPHANIYWIADNQAKGISATKILTLQAGVAYSHQLFDLPDEEILKKFRVDLEPLMGTEWTIIEAQIKRWRYSQPAHTHVERCLITDAVLQSGEAAILGFAGDAFGGPRVEGAFLSGIAAGNELLKRL
jgi:hypothetical protein